MTVRRCEGATVRRCGWCEGARVRGCDGAFHACSGDPGRHGAAVWAHHSFSAEVDINKPIKLSGTITEVRWSNPHSWIYIDVKDESGKVVNWAFEMQPANALPSWLAPDRCCRGHRRHRRGVGVAERKSNGQYQHDCPFRRSTAVRWRSANRRRRSTSRRGRASLIGIELYPRRGL